MKIAKSIKDQNPQRNKAVFVPIWLCSFLLFAFFSAVPAQADNTASITVDASQTSHAVSPLLFGDQIQWPGLGQDLLQVDSITPTTGTLRTDVLNQLQSSGLKIMRYPGGTLSDYFHWSASTGTFINRGPNADLNGGTTTHLEITYFGADEFAQTAQILGADMMITANVGTGQASEAAAWLSYYKSKGIVPKYWEIGNEVYLPGNLYPIGIAGLDAVYKTPLQYAAAFDAYASALRAVDPTIQVGMIGVHISSAGLDTWNQTVLQNVSQKVDFIAVHNSYAPGDSSNDNSADIYTATLAAPIVTRANMDLIEQDITNFAPANSKNMVIAVTEHAALFTAPNPAPDPQTGFNDVARSQSLGGALYSALLFNLYMRDPLIQIANHINPLSPTFQALLNTKIPNLPGILGYDPSQPTYPIGYQPNPIREAYFYIFQLYADAAGGSLVSANVTGSPTFDSTAIGSVPAETNVPSLDAVAVQATAPQGRVYLYVVNRDLSRSITTNLQVLGLPNPPTAITAHQVNGADATAKNPQQIPNSVSVATLSIPPGSTFQFTFPAHSLTRFTIDETTLASLSTIQIFPNPLRPALGQTQMNFTQLPPGARLRIYTLAGEKVNDLTADANGAAAWDGTNHAGRKAASGVYIVYVQGGGDSKTLKVAIQR